jgi:prepilin-type N-terminal cleavage/methylation domain-containing protein
VKSPFTIYDLRFTICRKSAVGTGIAPVVSGVAPETRPRGKAALHLVSPDRAVPSQIRRDAGFDRRDACSTRLVFKHQSSIGNRKFRRAFTLVEMLVVISILGILAALTVPALKNLGKSNSAISASRQLLQAVGRARQLAIANHTTVFMVFVPANFWNSGTNMTPAQLSALINLCDKQLSGYTFIAYGAVGDQPGRHAWHYLEPWQALPDRSFIASWKFISPAQSSTVPAFDSTVPIYGFMTNAVPFPTVDAPLAVLPCIAFNYLGQLTTDGQNPASQHEYIPLARGSVAPAMDPSTKAFQFNPPSVSETPAGNSTNSAFNLVDIDPLTGRATLKFQKAQ